MAAQLSLGYANHLRSWINNRKHSLRRTLCHLSYFTGRIQGSYFKACSDISVQLAALSLAAVSLIDNHIHCSTAGATENVMGLLCSVAAFSSAGGHHH